MYTGLILARRTMSFFQCIAAFGNGNTHFRRIFAQPECRHQTADSAADDDSIIVFDFRHSSLLPKFFLNTKNWATIFYTEKCNPHYFLILNDNPLVVNNKNLFYHRFICFFLLLNARAYNKLQKGMMISMKKWS